MDHQAASGASAASGFHHCSDRSLGSCWKKTTRNGCDDELCVYWAISSLPSSCSPMESHFALLQIASPNFGLWWFWPPCLLLTYTELCLVDASNDWEAEVHAQISPAIAAELSRQKLTKAAWARLLSPLQQLQRIHHLLPPEEEVPEGEEPARSHPLWTAVIRSTSFSLVRRKRIRGRTHINVSELNADWIQRSGGLSKIQTLACSLRVIVRLCWELWSEGVALLRSINVYNKAFLTFSVAMFMTVCNTWILMTMLRTIRQGTVAAGTPPQRFLVGLQPWMMGTTNLMIQFSLMLGLQMLTWDAGLHYLNYLKKLTLFHHNNLHVAGGGLGSLKVLIRVVWRESLQLPIPRRHGCLGIDCQLLQLNFWEGLISISLFCQRELPKMRFSNYLDIWIFFLDLVRLSEHKPKLLDVGCSLSIWLIRQMRTYWIEICRSCNWCTQVQFSP